MTGSSSSSTSPNCVRTIDRMSDNEDHSSKAAAVIATTNDAGSPCHSPARGGDHLSKPSFLPIQKARSLVLQLSVLVGNLSLLFLKTVPLDPIIAAADDAGPQDFAVSGEVGSCMGELLVTLLDMAGHLSIDLVTAIRTKIELNCRKYPVHLCEGKAGKYTEYSDATGITKHQGQSTLEHVVVGKKKRNHTQTTASRQDFVNALDDICSETRQFAVDRAWLNFHLPRNLLLALTGELGELAELLQWKQDCQQKVSDKDRDKLSQEIADVSIYLIRLADVCGVSLRDELTRAWKDSKA